MYRVQLTEEQREELHWRTRAPNIKRRTRDRLEMVRLSDAGWAIPRIGQHLRVSPRRVRVWIVRFLDEGFDALADQPHRGRPSRLTPALIDALRTELTKQERTWTLGQLTAWLQEHHGVGISRDQLGERLRREQLSCRRTEPDLEHKQDPEQVARAQEELGTLEKGERPVAWTSAISTRPASR